MTRLLLALSLALALTGCDDDGPRPCYQPPSCLTDCKRVILTHTVRYDGEFNTFERASIETRLWREVAAPSGDAVFDAAQERLRHVLTVMAQNRLTLWKPDDNPFTPEALRGTRVYATERPWNDDDRVYYWGYVLNWTFYPYVTFNRDGWHVWLSLTLGPADEPPPDMTDWPMFGQAWKWGMRSEEMQRAVLVWCVDVEVTDMDDAELAAFTDQFARATGELYVGTPMWWGLWRHYFNTHKR